MEEWIDHVHDGVSWREAGVGGDSPPIIFLHGLGGTRSAWGSQLRGLSPRFRCIAWDMPGYGASSALQPLTYRGIAERLTDLVDIIGAAEVDLVGLSFGGMHALHTAINFPSRVRRMVLANTSPAFGMDGTIARDWVADRLGSLHAGGSVADGAEGVIDTLAAHPLTGTIRAEQINCFSEISNDGYRAAVECLPENDVRGDLATILQPALVIAGELDRETPLSYANVLHQGLASSRLEVLSNVGHLSPAEAPERFNHLVATFLGSG